MRGAEPLDRAGPRCKCLHQLMYFLLIIPDTVEYSVNSTLRTRGRRATSLLSGSAGSPPARTTGDPHGCDTTLCESQPLRRRPPGPHIRRRGVPVLGPARIAADGRMDPEALR